MSAESLHDLQAHIAAGAFGKFAPGCARCEWMERRCHFCHGPGADATAGIGDVPGVAVHLSCWQKFADDTENEES